MEIFRTGEVAKMLGVHRATVCNWMNAGKLDGLRLPSGQRRVPGDAVREFAKANGLPVPAEVSQSYT